jgi:hypothetical protein
MKYGLEQFIYIVCAKLHVHMQMLLDLSLLHAWKLCLPFKRLFLSFLLPF